MSNPFEKYFETSEFYDSLNRLEELWNGGNFNEIYTRRRDNLNEWYSHKDLYEHDIETIAKFVVKYQRYYEV